MNFWYQKLIQSFTYFLRNRRKLFIKNICKYSKKRENNPFTYFYDTEALGAFFYNNILLYTSSEDIFHKENMTFKNIF